MQAADALADAETINEVCTVLRPELMKALGMLEGMEAPQPHQLPPTPRILHPSQRPRSKSLLDPILCCITPKGTAALPPSMHSGKGVPLPTPRTATADSTGHLGFQITRATALQVPLPSQPIPPSPMCPGPRLLGPHSLPTPTHPPQSLQHV